ncbi:hypothetical protein AVEN_136355-1 [Araneus ventricosus]|uniref:Uncharacterized protein n=1 Tax=Araneus ventricosus TaxID=182803 RepID=A0A4Y2E4Y3_ARAVE|nr:hypothetical protein AVEN_136355-1 [Araneus ventricosus]
MMCKSVLRAKHFSARSDKKVSDWFPILKATQRHRECTDEWPPDKLADTRFPYGYSNGGGLDPSFSVSTYLLREKLDRGLVISY